MRRACLLVLALGALPCGCRAPRPTAPGPPAAEAPGGGGPRLAHEVYFRLHDASPAATRDFARACRERLAHLPGVLVLEAGPRDASLEREVNDLEFDVALHVVFADRASYEAYLVAPEHVAFVDEYLPRVAALRVFDWVP